MEAEIVPLLNILAGLLRPTAGRILVTPRWFPAPAGGPGFGPAVAARAGPAGGACPSRPLLEPAMADDKAMPFLGHLAELRERLIKSIAAVGAGLVLAFWRSHDLMMLLKRPLVAELTFRRRYPFVVNRLKATPPEIIFTAPAEAFWAHLKVALLAGLVLALPVVLFQVWPFVEPGLLPQEKRFALLLVILSTMAFAVGMAFAFTLVLPYALTFLLTFDPKLKPLIRVREYVDFAVKFLLAFGLILELPLAIAIAAHLGMVTPQFLARNRKYALLLSFIAGAVLTPTPDIFNQSMMAVPTYVLYEAGVLAARLMARRRARVLAAAG